ncbi:putative bifunctional diguanylate cyclase/phosphodiesterase [Marinobacterium aestuariivivens]|uniref:Bifunctional diguanylate cyclase/phosphodiesterase n=1 Tax=Marinobacterium aestuariivivens TaxID=1698799 RepID=A0ABW1ZYN6_9GAMM
MQATRNTKYWLILISAALLLVFSVVLYIQYHQSRLLNSTVQYNESNVSWNVFQLEAESLRFGTYLQNALDPASPDSLDELQLRYEIFYSRADVLKNNPSAPLLLDETAYKAVLQNIYRFLDDIAPYFETISTAGRQAAPLRLILDQLAPIQHQLHDLSLESVQRSSMHAETRAAEVERQILISTGLIVFQLLLTLLFFFIVIRQIRQLQTSRSQFSNLANFDPLTGLPNRRLFRDRLEQEIKKTQRTEGRLALLFLDLDHFKDINDTQGHDVGDILLKEAARRLKHCVRDSDTVARLGGDEFTIILSGLEDTGKAAQISQSILQSFAEPFDLGSRKDYVSASIGITFYPDDAGDLNTLLKNADQAMYVAKEEGRNRFHYFTASMQEAAQARVELINDLRGALQKNEFRLLYQPIVDPGSGRVHKAEALIRWQHPERGQVSPLDFIPIAEETGLIVEIGNWVFREAAKQARVWRQCHSPDFQISINTSPLQLHAEGICTGEWYDYLQALELPGAAIAIEITEGLLMENSFATRLLEIQRLGIEVSLDDFGTGYSSMSYLKKFDIDYLKIDKSFVRNLRPGSSDHALCEAMIVMAHKLGLKVIAEGIETSAQLGLLSDTGCDYGQGYYFARPMTQTEFDDYLKKSTAPLLT